MRKLVEEDIFINLVRSEDQPPVECYDSFPAAAGAPARAHILQDKPVYFELPGNAPPVAEDFCEIRRL